jgi:DNA-directed RNA polymerase subunit RPC12/RpoP
MAETLMVTCVRCSTAFATPLQVDRATLEAMVLHERYACPGCGHVAAYVKADHFHRLVLDDGR